ncbi:MAG: T9SS type A sorting domain-containing protein [Candidatus Delongbacteria bacterium]|jgi:hypothetical protein|nr:T9SS type A sorting domain-containing protein [Candidatus Delongbacteria bacterium]
MKRILIFILLISIVFVSFAQKKILIDNIHGVDYVGDFQVVEIYPIDFYSIFPRDELTIITPDNFPIDNMIVNETITGMYEKTYVVELPGYYPENPTCLYVYTKCTYESEYENENISLAANGVVKNPSGEVVVELFNGATHVELAMGEGWQIELDFPSSELSYEVKIGYGKILFGSEEGGGYVGKYQLRDYDCIIRIKENCYYAVNGVPLLYDNSDLMQIEGAFMSGISFINVDNLYHSMWDKPFIHFYSEEDISIDVSIEFPGVYTLLSDNPQLSMNKSKKTANCLWKGHNLKSKSNNEIIYEGALHNKLNLLDFKFSGEHVDVANRINYMLNDLFLFKYESQNLYRIKYVNEIEQYGKTNINDWQYLTTDQIITWIKKVFYDRGIKEGLYENEIDHLVNDFHWVESLLYRSRINKDEYFGFYHFGKDVYDKLVKYDSDPYPEELNRTTWVMLSFITERDDEQVIMLDREVLDKIGKTGLKVNEYGVVDEYYTNSYYKSENDLFGIEFDSHTDYDNVNLLFYNNPVALDVANGQTQNTSLHGTYRYNYPQYQHLGILYCQGYEEYPAAYGKVIRENGQLLVLGSSYFFIDGNTLGNDFLNSAVTELIDNRILTGIESDQNLITDYNLKAYPNPFNPSTEIEFSLKKDAFVELSVYNSKGQEVTRLVSSKLEKGSFNYTFNAKDQASGLYTCILKVDNDVVDMKKMMFLK